MFNIGIFELFLIFFFMVLFVKPEEIPKISKNLGLFYRKINRYFLNLKYELNEITIDKNYEEIKLERSKKKKYYKKKRINQNEIYRIF